MADGGGYAKKKSLKRGPRFKERTTSDVCRLCRLCRNNLKQKLSDFFKNSYITAVNVFMPWTREGHQMSVQEKCKMLWR